MLNQYILRLGSNAQTSCQQEELNLGPLVHRQPGNAESGLNLLNSRALSPT